MLDPEFGQSAESAHREQQMSAIRLKRGPTATFVPAPSTVLAGDFVFTSTIYPLDEIGHAVAVDEALGEAGPTAVAVQTQRCFEILEKLLNEHKTSLDRVLKVSVQLASAADFYEFKIVWQEYFRKDPPARTTVEVGDTLPFRGARISIDAIALAGDSMLERQVLHDPDGTDPLPAEWAPHAIRAGNIVFCSGFTASDFRSGLAVGKAPGFPNYGSDALMQAEYVFERLNRVLGQAGTSLENALEAYLYEPDLKTFNDVDTVWRRYMPLPPGRASMGMRGLIVPGACFIADFTVLVPDEKHIKAESREGIEYHPVTARKVNFTPTLKAGPWLYIAGKTAGNMSTVHAAPMGLPHHFSDIEIQTRHVLDTLKRQIEANGSDWAHCHHVRVWLVEPRRDYRGFIRVWQDYFPDPAKAPVLAYVPATATMYPGPLIEIDPTCVLK
jgi:enamine deaminase RidA (YjgF/YER057c/UK114 family)